MKILPLRRRARPSSRGQALVEFAIILPLLMLVIGGIVQLGMLFWAQNTITQIARDTGRWAATQSLRPCDGGTVAVVGQANTIALNSSLISYSGGWTGSPYPTSPRPADGVEVAWQIPTNPPGLTNVDCPPVDNSQAWFVTIRVNHVVPTFFPGMSFICPDPAGCSLSSTAQFRMEPTP